MSCREHCLQVSCLTYSSALEMEAICYSETSGCLWTTQRYIPEDGHHCENFTSRTAFEIHSIFQHQWIMRNGEILCVRFELSGSHSQNSLESRQKRIRYQSAPRNFFALETHDTSKWDCQVLRSWLYQRTIDFTPLDPKSERGRRTQCSSRIFRKRRQSLGPFLVAYLVTILWTAPVLEAASIRKWWEEWDGEQTFNDLRIWLCNKFRGAQKVPSCWTQKDHYCIHKKPPLDPILNKINPIHSSHLPPLRSILLIFFHLLQCLRPLSGRSVEWTLIPPPIMQIKKKKNLLQCLPSVSSLQVFLPKFCMYFSSLPCNLIAYIEEVVDLVNGNQKYIKNCLHLSSHSGDYEEYCLLGCDTV
jgi:hypothetical protein